jgi:hypothetical protein
MSVSASPLATVLVRNVISQEISLESIHHPAQFTERQSVHVAVGHKYPFHSVRVTAMRPLVVDGGSTRADTVKGGTCRPGSLGLWSSRVRNLTQIRCNTK